MVSSRVRSTTVSAAAATFSNTAIASASAKSTAVAGNYQFYVEQLATAGQVAYGGISDTVAAGAGTMTMACIAAGGAVAMKVGVGMADGTGMTAGAGMVAGITVGDRLRAANIAN